jgi:3-hydroxyacyl-CoA dehydrogenase
LEKKIKKVGIIGAGVMGAGIAQVMSAASLEVVLIDIKTEFVQKGLERIAGRLAKDIQKGKIDSDEKDAILKRITGSVMLKDAADADLIIEAIIEDSKLKGNIFQELNDICHPDTIFSTNTSTLSVTNLAAMSGRGRQFIGLHFFNPVQVMRLVEIIPGLDTSEEIISNVKSLVEQIKKTPVIVQDCPGFLVNRILISYSLEALRCAEEGIPIQEIDTQARDAGFPIGPIEINDLIGLDVALHSMSVIHDAYGDRFPFSELVRKLCDAGRLGLKTGKGIYNEGQIDEELQRIIKDLGITTPRQGPSFHIDRCILRMVNEAVACLQEGVATADDIDRAMVFGAGFPNQQGIGGPLHWADDKGLDVVIDSLNSYKDSLGHRFWPHHLLKTYAAAGYKGRKAGRGFFVY